LVYLDPERTKKTLWIGPIKTEAPSLLFGSIYRDLLPQKCLLKFPIRYKHGKKLAWKKGAENKYLFVEYETEKGTEKALSFPLK
jgi:hypothetical protein